VKKGREDPLSRLRKQAEKILGGRGEGKSADLDFAQLLHELEVHHVELELQNEELRRTQKELGASRNEYLFLFDSAPVGFVTVNAKGLVTRANRAAEEMLAASRKDLIGRSFSKRIHPEDYSPYFSMLKKLAPRGDIGSCELRMIGKGAGLIYIRMEATAVLDEAGRFSSWHFALSDITKQKEAEAALKKAHDDLELRVQERTAELEKANAKLDASNRRLEELNKDLHDFAFVASHDLQEPLRKVRSFGDMLAGKCGDSLDKDSRDYLKRMQTAAARMQNLLNSLLAYSRVTTRAEPIRRTDLGKCAKEALSDLEIMIKEKNARVEVGDLPTVRADRVQMIQLFQNLVGNALKYRRDGEEPRVRIYSRKTGDGKEAYEILVEDNGIGFEEKYLDRIFLPFQRLHGRSSEYEGVGMGLAICKKIAERHGGEITAKSDLGKGSTFIVTLPAGTKTR
jgi:PAS domain S-box-containing protein